jgi:hypothetical protein
MFLRREGTSDRRTGFVTVVKAVSVGEEHADTKVLYPRIGDSSEVLLTHHHNLTSRHGGVDV